METNKNRLREYYPNIRHEDLTWLISHIKHLLFLGEEYKDSTMILYACYEARNFIEKLEFLFIIASINQKEWPNAIQIAKKKNGIQELVGKYHNSFYHYITFLGAFMKVGKIKGELGKFNFKQLRQFVSQLNNYIHISLKNQSDL